LLLQPAARPEARSERDFWRRSLAPLTDFADLRATPEEPFEI
jgi:hypothetical protein